MCVCHRELRGDEGLAEITPFDNVWLVHWRETTWCPHQSNIKQQLPNSE